MPHLVVYGLAKSEFSDKSIDVIEGAVTAVILGIEELELNEGDISFAFVHDPSVTSRKIPIVVFVKLLLKRRKRTLRVKRRLAKAIASAFKAIPGNSRRVIEVATETFDPAKEGYCRIDP